MDIYIYMTYIYMYICIINRMILHMIISNLYIYTHIYMHIVVVGLGQVEGHREAKELLLRQTHVLALDTLYTHPPLRSAHLRMSI